MQPDRVYIVQFNKNRDFSKSENYGEPRYIFDERDELFFDNYMYQHERIEKMERALKNFDFKKDYILLAGDPLLISLVISYLTKEQRVVGDSLKVLKYDNHHKLYFSMEIKNEFRRETGTDPAISHRYF